MKRFFCLFCVLAVCLCCLAGCGTKSNASANVNMYDLSRAMLAAAEFGEMNYVSSTDSGAKDLFTYLSDMDYDKVAQFFLSYAKDGKGNADELAVIRVKDKSDVDAALKSLQAHLQKRINLYKTYDPTQSERIENGLAFTQGDCAVLIVSTDNAAVKSAFLQALEEN